MTYRVVIPFALICGVLCAFASSVRAQAPAPVTPVAAAPVMRVFAPPPACRPKTPAKPAAAKAPSQALFDAFGVLRRERTDADTLSKEARDALMRAGVRVHDLNAARLLREAPGGGRAWVVPVADVTPLLGGLFARCITVPRRSKPPRAAQRRAAARRAAARRAAARRALRRRRAPRVPGPVLVVPPRTVPAMPLDFGPVPFGSYPPEALDGTPKEGLVVVAQGNVPAGGGGTHKQLIRGLSAPVVAPCSGPKHGLVGVSGIVPDGVGAAFLTSADGTAVKAEVKDNAYAFLVAPAKGRDAWAPRYVVWTGGDGTPHVQQVALGNLPARLCKALSNRQRPAAIALTPRLGPGAFPSLPGRLHPALVAPGPVLVAPGAVPPGPLPAPRPSRPPRPRRP